jgi:type I restriction enzyme S subunit
MSIVALGEIAYIRRGASPRPIAEERWFSADGPGWVRISDATSGGKYLRSTQQRLSVDGVERSVRVAPGQLIVSVAASVGVTAIVDMDACIHDGWVVLSKFEQRADVEYLYYALSHGARELSSFGQSGAQTNINADILRQFQIWLPTLTLQRRIASVLAIADRAGSRIGELISGKRKLKEALLHELLLGSRRFPQFGNAPVAVVRLGDHAEGLSARNGSGMTKASVMGVLKGAGLVPMRDHVRATDLSRYLIVPPDAFAYNPMRVNIGSIARNLRGERCLVSPDYVVFTTNTATLLPAYLDQLRYSRFWSDFVRPAGSGSVRVRIYYRDLAELRLPLPSLDEQQKIVATLEALDHEIALLERLRDAYEAQKRALMVRLLSGEIEFPETSAAELATADV